MKIVSDYHDYYDNVQAWQSDSKDVFFRKRNPVDDKKIISSNTSIVNLPKFGYYYFLMDLYIIGFCGKLYPVHIKKVRNIKRKDHPLFYLDRIVNDYEINNDYKIIYDMKSVIKKLSHIHKKSHIAGYINNTLNCNILKNIFLEKNVPLFVATHYTRHSKRGYDSYEINYAPILKKYNFDTIFPDLQAFQEIEVYMANVLNNRENPDPKITDNIVLRDAKGFDKKSFKHRNKD